MKNNIYVREIVNGKEKQCFADKLTKSCNLLEFLQLYSKNFVDHNFEWSRTQKKNMTDQ